MEKVELLAVLDQLEKERRALVERHRSTLADEQSLAETREVTDWEEQALEESTDLVLDSLSGHEVERLRQISGAMARIAAGTYGHCVECNERISPVRLRTVPETALCIDCAEIARA